MTKYRVFIDSIIESDMDIEMLKKMTFIIYDCPEDESTFTELQRVSTLIAPFEDFEEKDIPIKIIDEDSLIGHA